MKARALDIQPGSALPGTKYVVNRLIGAGGMGVVYEVTKPPAITGVLKLMGLDLAGDLVLQRRFVDEVRILGQLDHPNIVRVFDYDTLTDGTPFYVMELLQGQTLRDVIASIGRVPPRAAFELTRQLCSALHCAHTHDVQVVHRDIKPDNIFLHTPKHGEPLVKLIDFGVSAFSDRKEHGYFAGTLSYAAPEQIQGLPSTPAADIYAVGCVLYEMLSGAGPADDVTHGEAPSAAALAYLTHVPRSLAQVAPWTPPSIVSLVHAALDKDPTRRPASAREFVERLADLEEAAAPHERRASSVVSDASARGGGGALRTLTVDFGTRSATAPRVERETANGSRPAPTAVGRGPSPRTDTLSSQHSDAREHPRTRPAWVIVVAGVTVTGVLATGLILTSGRRAPPPAATTQASAPTRLAPLLPVSPSAASPVSRDDAREREAVVDATPAVATTAADAAPAARAPRGQPRAAGSANAAVGTVAPSVRAPVAPPPRPSALLDVRHPPPVDDLIRTGP